MRGLNLIFVSQDALTLPPYDQKALRNNSSFLKRQKVS